jgi:proteasome lid subunit RPN8/RPN11
MRPTVRIAPGAIDQIRRHADRSYPEECCGFLLSPEGAAEPGGGRRVVGVEAAPNRSEGERHRRFVILPQELEAAEARACADGQVVSGFYHSHPDHPASPSQFDQEHAWPWYTYLIVAVTNSGEEGPIGAFELDPDRGSFRPLDWAVDTPAMPTGRT